MALLIFFLIVGLLLIGAVFCLTLIGGLPFSTREQGAPVKIGDRQLPLSQFSLGLMLIIWGGIWLMAWLYLATEFPHIIFNRWDARAIHYSVQLPMAFVFLVSGVAVLRKWRRWRGAYWTSVALLALSVAGSLALAPATDPVKQLFRYILPVAALAVIGGIRMMLFMIERITHAPGGGSL